MKSFTLRAGEFIPRLRMAWRNNHFQERIFELISRTCKSLFLLTSQTVRFAELPDKKVLFHFSIFGGFRKTSYT